MAIDKLQEKIRKLKNPSCIYFSMVDPKIPGRITEKTQSYKDACEVYFTELLEALADTVPAVRFSFGGFCVYPGGRALLQKLLEKAKRLGYYVLLDGPEMLTAGQTQTYKDLLCGEDAPFAFDGIILSAFLGSDVLKPFIAAAADGKTDVFAVIRTPNKSAAELQDLLTGGRLVHTAAADVVSRLGESILTRCGYSPVGVLASATAPDSLRNLRAKYKYLFLIADGYNMPGANAKNCSAAFDALGHGALVCTELPEAEGEDYIASAKEYAQRMRHNLTRYITVF